MKIRSLKINKPIFSTGLFLIVLFICISLNTVKASAETFSTSIVENYEQPAIVDKAHTNVTSIINGMAGKAKLPDSKSGSTQGAYQAGNESYLYIVNTVHKSVDVKKYYSTAALEFSRQKVVNKNKDTSGNADDYYTKYCSILLASPNIRDIVGTNFFDKVGAGKPINDELYLSYQYTYVVSFIDSRFSTGTDKYVTTYFIIKENDLIKAIKEYGYYDWSDELNDELTNNPDNAEYYYVKMNKVITTHGNDGYVSCPGSYTVTGGTTKISAVGNYKFTEQFGSQSLLASVHELGSAKYPGPKDAFDALFKAINNGSPATDTTRNSIAASWHSSVPIKLQKTNEIINFYDVDDENKIVWSTTVDEYKSLISSLNNPNITRTGYNVSFNGGLIKTSTGDTYRFLSTTEAKTITESFATLSADYNSMPTTYKTALQLKKKNEELGAKASKEKHYVLPFAVQAIGSEPMLPEWTKEQTDKFFKEKKVKAENFNAVLTANAYEWIGLNKGGWHQFWLPVRPLESPNPYLDIVYVDTSTGATLYKTSTNAINPANEYTYKVSVSDFNKWAADYNTAHGIKYYIAKNSAEWGSYSPMYAWTTSAPYISRDTSYSSANGKKTYHLSTITNTSSAYQYTLPANKAKDCDSQGRIVLYVPVYPEPNPLKVRYYVLDNPSKVLAKEDNAKVNDTGAVVFAPEDVITDTDGTVYDVVYNEALWGDNPSVTVWGTDFFSSYKTAKKEKENIVQMKVSEINRFYCKKNTIPVNKGYKTTLFIPVKEEINEMTVHYVDVETGNFVGTAELKVYDFASGNASYNVPNANKCHIPGTPADEFYHVCTTASEWGTYTPMFAYGSNTYLTVRYADALISPHKHYDATVRANGSTGYDFLHTGGGLTGHVGLYIPVKKISGVLTVHFVDVSDGSTVSTDKQNYSIDGSASYGHEKTLTTGTASYELVTASAEYGAYPPIFRYSTDKNLGKYNYTKCADKADGSVNPSINKGSIYTYSCGAGSLKDEAVLFIPVKKTTIITIESYLIDVRNSDNTTLISRTKDSYDPTKKYTYSPVLTLSGGFLAYKAAASTIPSTDWSSMAAKWSSLCNSRYPAISTLNGTVVPTEDISSGLTLTVKKNQLSGEVTLKLYYCIYEPIPSTTPIPTPPTGTPDFFEVGKIIVKNPVGGDNDGSKPNTAELGLNTGSSLSAPDIFGYNRSDEFNVGEGIPTTEKVTVGTETDTWYGDVQIGEVSVNPAANIRFSATVRIPQYKKVTKAIEGWKSVSSGPPEKVLAKQWTDGKHNVDPNTGTYTNDAYLRPESEWKIYGYDSYNNPLYGSQEPVYKKNPATGLYDELFYYWNDPTTYEWGTIGYYDDYERDGWKEIPTSSIRTFDAHRDVYDYKYNYVKDINLYILDSVSVMNRAYVQEQVWNSNYTIPYKFILNPVTSNGKNIYVSASDTDGTKIPSLTSDMDAMNRTHISVNSENGLSYDNYFDGVIAEKTVPASEIPDVADDYLKATQHTIIDAKGYTVTYWVHSEDAVKYNSVVSKAHDTANHAIDNYFSNKFVNNNKERVTMHSDTVKLKDTTYCQESSTTASKDSGGLLKTGAIVDDSNQVHPDKVTTVGRGTTKNKSVDKNLNEKIVTIPVDTENNFYGTKVTAKYHRFAYGTDSKTLTVDDGLRGNDNYELAILTFGAYVDKLDKNSKYRNNEPILVHSPVIAPIEIKEDEKGKTQNPGEISYMTQVKLDGTYKVDFVWEPLYGSDLYYKKGYYEDKNEGLTEYVKSKYVRFPFPVFTTAGEGTSDSEMTYYPLTKSEPSKSGAQTVKWTDWIELKEANWLTFDIYIPTWAKTGYYDETEDADKTQGTWVDAGIQVEVYANNSTDEHKKSEYKYNKNADLKMLQELGILPTPDISTYAATYSYPVQLTGWLYGFEIVTTNDQTTYGAEDEDTLDNVYDFVTNRKDLKVGTRNRVGDTWLRYTNGEDVTNDWDKQYTLPMTTGKSQLYKLRGTMRKGTEFSFIMKSILGGGIDPDNTYIDITPSFRYMDTAGNLFTSDQIEIYYDYVNENFLHFGTDDDTERTADLKFKLSSKWFYDVQRFTPLSKSKVYTDAAKVFGQYLNTWQTTAKGFGTTTNEIYNRTTTFGTLSKLHLDSTAMTFSGDESELEKNLAINGENVVRYPESSVFMDDFETSMQTWYGMYRIPHDLYVLRKDRYDSLEKYFEDNTYLEDKYDLFERDGYLILNFDITVYENKNGTWTPTTSYSTGPLDMWDRENDKLSTYTAYDGPWKDGEYTVDEDGNYHNDNEVTIEAKSGDIAVIVNHELGAEGGDELQPGGLWIGK